MRLAPEVRLDKEFEEYSKRVLDAGREYQVTILKSQLKINMDLLGRNKNDINEYVGLHPEFLTESVRKAVYDSYLKYGI